MKSLIKLVFLFSIFGGLQAQAEEAPVFNNNRVESHFTFCVGPNDYPELQVSDEELLPQLIEDAEILCKSRLAQIFVDTIVRTPVGYSWGYPECSLHGFLTVTAEFQCL